MLLVQTSQLRLDFLQFWYGHMFHLMLQEIPKLSLLVAGATDGARNRFGIHVEELCRMRPDFGKQCFDLAVHTFE